MAASCLATNVVPVYYEATATTRIVVASLCLGTLVITAFTWLSSYPVDFAIPCVIVWALCGVYMELNGPLPVIPETFSEKQINGVQYSVIAGIALIGTGIVAKALYVLFKQRPEALKAQAEEKKEIASASESEEGSNGKASAEESV